MLQSHNQLRRLVSPMRRQIPYRNFWFDNKKPEENLSDDSKSLVPQFGENSPRLASIIMLPINRRPIFPGFATHHMIHDKDTVNALYDQIQSGNNYVGTFLRKTPVNDTEKIVPEIIKSIDDVHKTGTFALVQNIVKSENGCQLLLIGNRRINLDGITSFGPPTIASVTHWSKHKQIRPDQMSPTVKAYCNEIIVGVREIVNLNPLANEHISQWVSRIELSNPFTLADFAAAMTTADDESLQRVLEADNVEERLAIALELLTKEKELAKIRKEINKQVEDKMSKSQREYFLREQLKSIKAELGMERDDKDELIAKYSEKIKKINENSIKSSEEFAEVIKVIDDELKKLSNLERNSPEFNVTRSYLDWLTSIPWGKLNEDKLHLADAKEQLDKDHYGLDEIKKRILEFIAVGKLRGTVAGKIICLIGPPGVGKTSIAKSIAVALNKSFYRFSVGGLTDIAEIKGHRRTYIGAMPGKPILCLKATQCINPLILIDEIDKLGRGYSGDPASALLELLDPNQNSSFVDHYLDVPVDFSNVLFVCTANDESTIPGPLRDRMEVIRLSGYDIPEKVSIAGKYLVPKAIKESGLLIGCPNYKVDITDEALEYLVKNYCRESGVRSLEKHIEKVIRKIAYNAVGEFEKINGNKSFKDMTGHVTISSKDLEGLIGQPKYAQDTIYDSADQSLPPGIVMGLAWNPLGGSPVFIETAAIPVAMSESGGNVNIITGQLGNVMKESVNIAYTYSRKFLSTINSDNSFFKSHQLHLHVPEGAVEKDGPSAGVAMATSLISISTNVAVKPRLAMTGELSLTGKVLPVGGIKEKVLAARRSGADTVILPLANKRDYDELPEYVKNCVTVHFVNDYQQVYNIAFGR